MLMTRLLPLILCVSGASASACNKKETTAAKPAGLEAPAAPAAAPTPPPPAPAPTPPPAEPAAEAAGDTPDPKQTITGNIVLPAARKKDVKKGDTIFIVARRAGGPPGPGSMLAVQRLQADDFPMKFAISGRDAMIPGTPFEGSVSITVRVDKDGDAMTRKKGDISGQVNDVKVGSQDVTINLDTVQKEDHTLGGAPGPGGMRPQGMPPGHP